MEWLRNLIMCRRRIDRYHEYALKDEGIYVIKIEGEREEKQVSKVESSPVVEKRIVQACTIDLKNWMLGMRMANFWNLILPGTHDTAAY